MDIKALQSLLLAPCLLTSPGFWVVPLDLTFLLMLVQTSLGAMASSNTDSDKDKNMAEISVEKRVQ